MRILLLITALMLSTGAWTTQMFSWTDAEGNTVYGDDPPDMSVAKAVKPPSLTVLKDFSNRYGKNIGATGNSEAIKPSALPSSGEEVDVFYESLSFIAPKHEQAIRSNEGDVSAALAISPKLRRSDKIVITLDGKEHSKGILRMANFTNLDRGGHTLEASVIDKFGKVLISSRPVSFSLLRNSVLINKKPYSPYGQ